MEKIVDARRECLQAVALLAVGPLGFPLANVSLQLSIPSSKKHENYSLKASPCAIGLYSALLLGHGAQPASSPFVEKHGKKDHKVPRQYNWVFSFWGESVHMAPPLF